MTKDFAFKEHRRIIILLFVFSCIATYLAYNNIIAFGSSGGTNISGGSMTNEDMSGLSGAFAPFIGMSSSPFIALTVLSGAGSFLNSGAIDSANIPFSNVLTQLPISHTGVFISLLSVTIVKFLLSIFGASKVFCDATIGKLENYVGTALTVGGAFLLTSITTVYAAEIAASNLGNGNFGAYLLTNIIAFFLAVFAYAVYIVMKTMILAIDILAFLVSPIPGTTAFFTIAKHAIISAYTWYTLTNPFVASVIGIICLFIAFMVFKKAKRLELYYRKIYLIPFFNALFRRGLVVPIMPKKLPYGLSKEFSNVDICIEGFFMNKVSKLYKRELCYFVRAEGVNYIFKKRILGKVIKFEITDETYIEKCFRFIRIFTNEGLHTDLRKVYLVLRREHGKNIAELVGKANLVDYNLLLEERRRKKAEEMALKAQMMKEEAARKLKETGKTIKNAFGGLFASKSMCKGCGAELVKNSKFCGACGTAM